MLQTNFECSARSAIPHKYPSSKKPGNQYLLQLATPSLTIPAMANRLAQVSGHISNAYGRGLLAGEVAIITGAFPTLPSANIPHWTRVSNSRSRTGVVFVLRGGHCTNTRFGHIGHRQECSVAVCQGGSQSRRQRVCSGRVGIAVPLLTRWQYRCEQGGCGRARDQGCGWRSDRGRRRRRCRRFSPKDRGGDSQVSVSRHDTSAGVVSYSSSCQGLRPNKPHRQQWYVQGVWDAHGCILIMIAPFM